MLLYVQGFYGYAGVDNYEQSVHRHACEEGLQLHEASQEPGHSKHEALKRE